MTGATVHGITAHANGTWILSLYGGSVLLWGFPSYTAASNFMFSYLVRQTDTAIERNDRRQRAEEQRSKWKLDEPIPPEGG